MNFFLFVLLTCFCVEGYGEITQPRTDLIQVVWDVMPFWLVNSCILEEHSASVFGGQAGQVLWTQCNILEDLNHVKASSCLQLTYLYIHICIITDLSFNKFVMGCCISHSFCNDP